MTPRLHRPEPVLRSNAAQVDRSLAPRVAARRLLDGEPLILAADYKYGVEILDQLTYIMRPPAHDAPFQHRQNFSRAYRRVAMGLLAPVVDHRVDLADAGHVGFLAELYPELPRFLLPFVQTQELHGTWVRYDEGVHLAVLGYKVHPFYGTYAPNRTTHLELFGTWLSQYQGPRNEAVDVGTGCGVLALMLAKAGFAHILATDSNPNSIESVRRELGRRPERPPIDLLCGDLLGEAPAPTELIVFNPPWTQGTAAGLVDQALLFEPELFPRFFDACLQALVPDGRVAMVFSNVMSFMQPDLPHPIETELARGRLRLVKKLQRQVKPPPPRPGERPRRTKEKVEIWELARA